MNRQPTDTWVVILNGVPNTHGIEFHLDNLLDQLIQNGYIQEVRNRWVIRWPSGLGQEVDFTTAYVQVPDEDQMDMVLHAFHGYHIHEAKQSIRCRYGWFTFPRADHHTIFNK